jgi:hypothetical protein
MTLEQPLRQPELGSFTKHIIRKILMRIAPASTTGPTTLAERENALKQFILDVAFDVPGDDGITLVARSTSSPVVKVLTQICRDMDRSLRVIFLEIDSTTEDHAENSMLDLPNAEFRVLGDARFGAAHEQMTLAGNRIWIGDCMRRDPAKRDAFEIYHACNASAFQDARTSFARLWTAARPLAKRVRQLTAANAIMAGQAADIPAQHSTTAR